MSTKLPPTKTKPELRAKFPILMSFAMVREKAVSRLYGFKELVSDPQVEVLLDSGAFTALNAGHEVKLVDYMRFVEKWHDRLFGYLALDVLGDPAATDRNLQEMLRAGFKPIPVHVRGDSGQRMDELFQLSDWVALGGLRRPHAGWAPLSYVKQKMQWAAGRNVHWLGYTSESVVKAFLPFSCDSSNWANGARFGTASMYLGDFRWLPDRHASAFEEHKFTEQEEAILSEIGFTTADVCNPTLRKATPNGKGSSTYARHVPFMMKAQSCVQYTYDMRRKLGPRVFIAATPLGDQLECLHKLIQQYA